MMARFEELLQVVPGVVRVGNEVRADQLPDPYSPAPTPRRVLYLAPPFVSATASAQRERVVRAVLEGDQGAEATAAAAVAAPEPPPLPARRRLLARAAAEDKFFQETCRESERAEGAAFDPAACLAWLRTAPLYRGQVRVRVQGGLLENSNVA